MSKTWKDEAARGWEPHPNVKPQRRAERAEREERRELAALSSYQQQEGGGKC